MPAIGDTTSGEARCTLPTRTAAANASMGNATTLSERFHVGGIDLDAHRLPNEID
jgi:hypothetical protein